MRLIHTACCLLLIQTHTVLAKPCVDLRLLTDYGDLIDCGLSCETRRVWSEDDTQYYMVRHISEKGLEKIGKFRVKVWQQEKVALKGDHYHDGMITYPKDTDSTTAHFPVFVDGELVASGSMFMGKPKELMDAYDQEFIPKEDENLKAAYIGSMVVDENHRGGGIAGKVTALRVVAAISSGAEVVYVWGTGEKRRDSLAKIGFVSLGSNQEGGVFESEKPTNYYFMRGKPADLLKGIEEKKIFD